MRKLYLVNRLTKDNVKIFDKIKWSTCKYWIKYTKYWIILWKFKNSYLVYRKY